MCFPSRPPRINDAKGEKGEWGTELKTRNCPSTAHRSMKSKLRAGLRTHEWHVPHRSPSHALWHSGLVIDHISFTVAGAAPELHYHK